MKQGDWIEELVVGGAKSYAYRTQKGKICVKQKGVALDRSIETRVNLESFKQMVLNRKATGHADALPWDPIAKIETLPRFTFAWDAKTKDVKTKYIARSVRSTTGEKRSINGFDTVPDGYD